MGRGTPIPLGFILLVLINHIVILTEWGSIDIKCGTVLSVRIEGRNPVFEALRNHRVLKVSIAQEIKMAQKIRQIMDLCNDSGVPIESTTLAELDRISETRHHQGITAYLKQPKRQNLRRILRHDSGEKCLLLLDHIQDPHNLGAILRTAESTGVDCVVVPKRSSVGLTATVHRVSMGGSIYVPVLRTSLYSTLKTLKMEGIHVIGVDPLGSKPYFSENLTGSVAFILGGEDKGISQGLLRKCDSIVHIPMLGRLESLNLSVAAAIVLYERVRQQIEKQNTP